MPGQAATHEPCSETTVRQPRRAARKRIGQGALLTTRAEATQKRSQTITDIRPARQGANRPTAEEIRHAANVAPYVVRLCKPDHAWREVALPSCA